MASIINLPVEAVLEGLQCNGKKRLLQGSFLVLVSGNVQEELLLVSSHIANCSFQTKRGENPNSVQSHFHKTVL